MQTTKDESNFANPIHRKSIPKMLGRYHLLRIVGVGGYGEVWEAIDSQLGRRVAVKLPTFSVADQKKATRFFREARTAAVLSHPSIISVFDAGIIENQLYLALEYLEGNTLDQAFQDAQIPEGRIIAMTQQLAEALAYAHRENVVHRDIKPRNIMLTIDGQIKLVDFGLAKVLSADSGQTVDGSILGTPAYMSPEQASGKTAEVGPLSDQYSLGAVMYWMITNRPPFEGIHSAVLTQVIHHAPTSPSEIRRGLDARLEAICRKAMSKRPKDRYEACEQLAEDLLRLSRNEEIVARPMTAMNKFARWRRDRPIEVAIGLLSSLILIFGLLFSIVGFIRAESLAFEAKKTADAAFKKMMSAMKLTEETNAQLLVAEKAEERAKNSRQKASDKRNALENLTLKLAESTAEVSALVDRVESKTVELSELKNKATDAASDERAVGTSLKMTDRIEVMDEIAKKDPRKAMRLACESIQNTDWKKATEWISRVPRDFDPAWHNLFRTIIVNQGEPIPFHQRAAATRADTGFSGNDHLLPLSKNASHGKISGPSTFVSTDTVNEVFWCGNRLELSIVDAKTLGVLQSVPRSLGDWVFLKAPGLLINAADFESSEGMERLRMEVVYATFYEKSKLAIVIIRRLSSNQDLEEFTVRSFQTGDVNSRWQEHGRYLRRRKLFPENGFEIIEFVPNGNPVEALAAIRCQISGVEFDDIELEPKNWNDLLISVDSDTSSVEVSTQLNMGGKLVSEKPQSPFIYSGISRLDATKAWTVRLGSPYSHEPIALSVAGLSRKHGDDSKWILSEEYLTFQIDSGFIRIDLLLGKQD